MYIDLGIIFFIIYFCSLLFFITGIYRVTISKNKSQNTYHDISVILCVRNGADSLKNILNDFKNQNYSGKLEFIIVNNNSNDDTQVIIDDYINSDKRFKTFNTKNIKTNLRHKKRALELGILNAKYEWLLFTDVDCRVDNNWVYKMAENYNDSSYVIGFSEVCHNNTLVSRFQSIDFRMLMISACGSTFMNYPLACSGQNQSYKKNIFIHREFIQK
mgnify:CR=1 FL=1